VIPNKEADEIDFNKIWRDIFFSNPPCDVKENRCRNCCWTCEDLPKCVKRWDVYEFDCRKDRTMKWCSASKRAYEKSLIGVEPDDEETT